MRRLLLLYPREWRRRYGAEMAAVLRQGRWTPRDVIDLLRGALDAHLDPQWPRRQSILRPLAIALIASAAAMRVYALLPQRWPAGDAFWWMPAWGWLGWEIAACLSLAWALAIVGRPRPAPIRLFASLLLLRLAGDWATGFPNLLLAHSHLVPYGTAAITIVCWGLLVATALRRTRLRTAAAFAIGCGLECVLEASLYLPLLQLVEPVRIVVWTAIVAFLILRLRRRPYPGAAAVGARLPTPAPPEPLRAAVGR